MKKKTIIFGLLIGFLVHLLRLAKLIGILYAVLFGLILIGFVLGGVYDKVQFAALCFFACIGMVTTLKWFIRVSPMEKYFENFTAEVHRRLAV